MSNLADINAPNQKAQKKVDYIVDKRAGELAVTTKLPADEKIEPVIQPEETIPWRDKPEDSEDI